LGSACWRSEESARWWVLVSAMVRSMHDTWSCHSFEGCVELKSILSVGSILGCPGPGTAGDDSETGCACPKRFLFTALRSPSFRPFVPYGELSTRLMISFASGSFAISRRRDCARSSLAEMIMPRRASVWWRRASMASM
jgi:hypothetical protein